MDKLLDKISAEVMRAFERAGYDGEQGKVTVSNRPDLCEYQCNGALALAKKYKKAPVMIADDVASALKDSGVFERVDVVAPGFLNLVLSKGFVGDYIKEMRTSECFGLNRAENPGHIVIDYGGPNVAKPLHIGHLRSAIIGESIKRILRYMGHKVTGDIHLGDWGLQMGLIIAELEARNPGLVYFDDEYTGEYPDEAPFDISALEEIYPYASAKSKEDDEFKAKALEATKQLQSGRRGYRALWNHIMAVSVSDLKRNYERLGVEFDLWYGESDADAYIPDMVEDMKKGGYAYLSEGALVVDVKRDTDKKEMPPCMILKSDGAALYETTDLATIKQRVQDFNPSAILYVADKRQELHFEQVFRCAKKTGLVGDNVKLSFIGFGTMNGSDGKPFKTRSGGVMRLESLITEVEEEMLSKIMENRQIDRDSADKTASIVALAALKYGDLSNQSGKDYVFDIDRFTSFEGDTGPYILYTIVRIKSILSKYREGGGDAGKAVIMNPENQSEKELMMELAKFNASIEAAYEELAPHKICSYIYGLANALNHFYHEMRILAEENEDKKSGYIALLELTRDVLETCIGLLGFEAPERM